MVCKIYFPDFESKILWSYFYFFCFLLISDIENVLAIAGVSLCVIGVGVGVGVAGKYLWGRWQAAKEVRRVEARRVNVDKAFAVATKRLALDLARKELEKERKTAKRVQRKASQDDSAYVPLVELDATNDGSVLLNHNYVVEADVHAVQDPDEIQVLEEIVVERDQGQDQKEDVEDKKVEEKVGVEDKKGEEKVGVAGKKLEENVGVVVQEAGGEKMDVLGQEQGEEKLDVVGKEEAGEEKLEEKKEGDVEENGDKENVEGEGDVGAQGGRGCRARRPSSRYPQNEYFLE